MSAPISLSERADHADLGALGEQEMPADRPLLRMGAVSMVLGLLLDISVGFFDVHGGAPPDVLRAVLPRIAANDYWMVVHLAQFVGNVLLLVGFVALYRSITQGARGMPDYIGKLLAVFEAETQKSEDRSYMSLGPPAQSLTEPLSYRELEVVQLIAQGLSNREISERLFLALDTVKGHNRKIFGKLRVQRRTEAIARARELGLL